MAKEDIENFQNYLNSFLKVLKNFNLTHSIKIDNEEFKDPFQNSNQNSKSVKENLEKIKFNNSSLKNDLSNPSKSINKTLLTTNITSNNISGGKYTKPKNISKLNKTSLTNDYNSEILKNITKMANESAKIKFVIIANNQTTTKNNSIINKNKSFQNKLKSQENKIVNKSITKINIEVNKNISIQNKKSYNSLNKNNETIINSPSSLNIIKTKEKNANATADSIIIQPNSIYNNKKNNKIKSTYITLNFP